MAKTKVVRARIEEELIKEFKKKLTDRYGDWEREISKYLRWAIKNFDMLIEIKEGNEK